MCYYTHLSINNTKINYHYVLFKANKSEIEASVEAYEPLLARIYEGPDTYDFLNYLKERTWEVKN